MSGRFVLVGTPTTAAWLAEHGHEVVGQAESARDAVRMASDRRADIIVCAAGSAREVAELLLASAPGIGCVAVGAVSPDEERRILRSGAVEVLPPALDDGAVEHLSDALAEVARRRDVLAAERATAAPQIAAGKTVTVVSAKGGVGRSFIAANLAAYLADREPTVLLDLDLQFGDVSHWGAPDGTGDRSIDQLVAVVTSGEIQLEDVREVGRTAFGKVTLLPGTRSPIDGAAWANERGLRSLRLVHALRRWFPWTIVDGLAGLIEPVVGTARASHLIVVVTGPDIGAVRATQRYLALLDRFAPQPRIVVVDRADRGERRDLIESALAGERIAWVKEDRTFARRLVLEGLAATQQRDRRVSRGLREVADLVIGGKPA